MAFIVGIAALVLFILGFNPIAQAFYKKDYTNKTELLMGSNLVLFSAVLIAYWSAFFAAALVSLWVMAALVISVAVTAIVYVFNR